MKNLLKQDVLALISGTIFGVGLGLSQMIDRQRVLGFLDIAGDWDPTLIFVLAGAVTFTVVAFRFVLRRKTPLIGDKFWVPKRHDVDWKIVTGAAIFGIGWGLSGYCPGPGIVALVLGRWNPVLFVFSLAVGMLVFNRYNASH